MSYKPEIVEGKKGEVAQYKIVDVTYNVKHRLLAKSANESAKKILIKEYIKGNATNKD